MILEAGQVIHPPLVAHVIHHLVIGGLENGLVNLINHLPEDRYRHAVVCMTDYSEFRNRIVRKDVQVYAMNKRAGQDYAVRLRLYRLFRSIKPDLLHSRNLTALDSLLPAALAGVPRRLHGEHGRDEHDPFGVNRKLQWLRKLRRPLIDHYVPLSTDIELYLRERIGVPERKITRIYNGVDTNLFRPGGQGRSPLPGNQFSDPNLFIIGTVGRMQPVKDPCNLVRALLTLFDQFPQARKRVRLVMVGNGPLRPEIEAMIQAAGAADIVWLPGARHDVAEILRGLDLFVLPSLAEGISNTILEAMASGLPVVATCVGGNPELVEASITGQLVPPREPTAMASAIRLYLENRSLGRAHGEKARTRVESCFSLPTMVSKYMALYDWMLRDKAARSMSKG